MTSTVGLPRGARVAYERYGDPDGPPLVVLHGFPDSRLTGVVLDAAGRRAGVAVLAPDRPGIGLSTGSLRTLADCGSWLGELADALSLERFPLVGLSGGGPFALACALVLPERLERVVVASGLGPPETGRERMPLGQRLGLEVALRAPGAGAAVLEAVAALAGRRPRLFLALVRWQTSPADGDHASDEGVARAYAEAFRQGRAGVRRELELLFRPWGFRPEEIALPVHLLHGTADVTVPPAAAESLAQRVPGATLELVEGAGHLGLLATCSDRIVALARGANG